MTDLQLEDKKSKKINQKISHSNGGCGLVVVGGALVFGAILIGFMNRRSKERRRPNNKGVEDLSKIISQKINCKKEEDMQGLRSLLLTPSPSKICGEEEESKICFMNAENLILGEGFVSKIDGKEEQFTCVNLERDSDSWGRTLSAGDDCEKNEDVVVVDLAGFTFNSPQQDCIEVVDDDVEVHMDSASVKTIPVIEDVTESPEEMDVTHVGEGTVEDNPSIQILEEEEEEEEEEEYLEEEDEEEEEEEESVEQKGEEGSDGIEVSSTESNPEAIWPAESIERSLGTKTAHVEISNENDEKEIEKTVIKEEVIEVIKEEYQKGRSEINGGKMMMMMTNNETETAHIKISEEIDEEEAQKSVIKEEENKEYQKGRSEIAEAEIMMIYNEKKAVHIKISDENDKEEAEKAIMKEEKVEIKEEDQKGRSEIAEEEMMMRNKEMKTARIEISKENDEEDEMAVIKGGGEKGGSEIEAEEMMMMMMMNKTNENEKGFRIMQVQQMHSSLVSRFWLMSTLVGLILLLLSHLVVRLHYELYDESSSHAI